jgi:crotonobetainyl-CoA:carnitine CoA-transferase CaiB-like acyl-CoA transferase
VDHPLRGLKVVEVSHYIAGPVAGMVLGDLGADVIKIESPSAPDPTRSFVYGQGLHLVTTGGRYMLWESFNRNKKSLALDLKTDRGREILHDLIRTADVFVSNLRPESLARWGADWDSLRAVNPRIVYALGEGLGSVGPRAADRTMDTVGMAYAGLMYTISAQSDRPHYPLGAMSDVQSGTNLAFAAITGIVARDRTGEAQFARASQLQTLMWMQSYNIAVTANLGRNFSPETVSPFFAIYPCKDDKWIAVSMQKIESEWPMLLRLFGFDELLTDPRLEARPGEGALGVATDPADQARIAAEVAGILTRGFRTRTRDEWLETLRPTGIGVGPVNTIAELIDDPHVEAEEFMAELDNGLRLARSPIGIESIPDHGAPAHGANTIEILSGLGLSDESIAALYADGVVV